MGQSEFYFKAIFETEDEAERNLPLIKEYLKQQTQADREWQKIRSNDLKGTPKERYNYLKNKYKLAFLTVPEFKEIDKSMNELAGFLVNFKTDENGVLGEGNIFREYNIIYLRAVVWHFSDWQPLVDFAKLLGATAGYINEEYVTSEDFFEMIALEPIKELSSLKDFWKLSKKEKERRLDKLLILKNLE